MVHMRKDSLAENFLDRHPQHVAFSSLDLKPLDYNARDVIKKETNDWSYNIKDILNATTVDMMLNMNENYPVRVGICF